MLQYHSLQKLYAGEIYAYGFFPWASAGVILVGLRLQSS